MAEVSRRNEVLKQLIDQLRQMLDSMNMWGTYKNQLERIRVAQGQ